MKTRKKLLIIALVILGGMSMTLLSACRESSRDFIEGKAAKLEKAYPSKDLFELFDKFPNGFHFHTLTFFDEGENGTVTHQKLVLEGDPKTKEIKGTVVQIRTDIDKEKNRKETTLFESDVIYTKDGYTFSNPDVTEKNLRHKDFLIQKFTINKESLSKLKLVSKSHSLETGSADISYDLQDKTVNQFLSLDDDTKLRFWINMNEYTINDGRFWYSLNFIKDGVDYTENIYGK